MTNGNNNIEELEELLSELEGQDNQAITPYSEDEDAVTQLMEAPLSEQEWMVQVTALDRRMMATEQLLGEFQSGKLSDQTLVWRGGMDDWLPLGRVEELSNPEAAMAATATVTEANAAPPSPMGSAPAWSAPQPMASRPHAAPPPPPGSAAAQPAPSAVSSPAPVKPADVTHPVPSPQTYTARPVAVDFSGTAAAEEAGGLLQSKRAVLSLGAVALVAVVAIGLSLPASVEPSAATKPAEDKATAAAQPIEVTEPAADDQEQTAEAAEAPAAEAEAAEEAKPAEEAPEMKKAMAAEEDDEDEDEAAEAATEAEEKPVAAKRTPRKRKSRSRWRRRSSKAKKAARRAKQEEQEEAAEPARQETLSEAMKRAGGGSANEEEEDDEKPVASRKVEEPEDEPVVTSASSTFDGSAAEKVLNQAASQAANCQPPGGPSGSGRVRVKYATSGKVDSVTILTDDFKNTTTGSCVRLLFRRARVPKFEGEPVVLTKRFSIP